MCSKIEIGKKFFFTELPDCHQSRNTVCYVFTQKEKQRDKKICVIKNDLILLFVFQCPCFSEHLFQVFPCFYPKSQNI